MSEYSWRNGDRICGEPVPSDSLPQRIALTATAVVTRTRGQTVQLLLCNPHPESWNTWMLPYGSVVVEIADIPLGTTFEGLIAHMQAARQRESAAYEDTAFSEASRLAGMAGHEFRQVDSMSNYSLKFSKSAGLWTAYSFAYHIARTGESANPSVEAVWLSIDEELIDHLLQELQFEGHSVADNVAAILRDGAALDVLVAG